MNQSYNSNKIIIGAVVGEVAWKEEKIYYKCLCQRCNHEDIWTKEEMVSHNEECIKKNVPSNLRILNKDRKITAVGVIVESEKNGKTECIEYRSSSDIDVLFHANGAIAKHREWKQFINGTIKNPQGNAWKYVGMTEMMNCGMNATIVEYRKAHDIDIEFEDGYRVNNVSMSTFRAKSIKNPNVKRTLKDERIGLKTRNNQGLEMEIVDYADAENMKVKFLIDGTVVNGMYKCFIKGSINHPTYYQNQKIGEKRRAKNGLMMEIIEYVNNSNCTIKFEDGVTRKCIYSEFKRGGIKHPFLSMKKECNYMNFSVKYAFVDGENTIYKCKCNLCDYEDLLTPQQMIRHNEKHNKK